MMYVYYIDENTREQKMFDIVTTEELTSTAQGQRYMNKMKFAWPVHQYLRISPYKDMDWLKGR